MRMTEAQSSMYLRRMGAVFYRTDAAGVAWWKAGATFIAVKALGGGMVELRQAGCNC